MSNSCLICAENFNKSNRVDVKCQYCEFTSCRSCCETYILGETVAKCMDKNCSREWTRKYMMTVFTKSFMGGAWKQHREKVLLDQETALLPATQPIVEQRILREKDMEEIRSIDKMIAELGVRRRMLNDRFQAARGNNVDMTKKTPAFVRACPEDNCRGFLSSQWKCGLCEKYTCAECHVVKGSRNDVEHVCDPNEVATATLLKKDTKPCPTCSTGIFKIEGCDQMWCTQCHTAFSWNTGRIETNIHNPHFYEWQRKNNRETPRAHGDIICGRELDHRVHTDIGSLIRRKYPNQPKETIENMMMHIIRSTIHLRQQDMPKYAVDHVTNNLELRVSYMRNIMTKEQFMVLIQRENKKNEKRREIYMVLSMFVQTVTDIVFRVREMIINSEPIDSILTSIQEVEGLREYSNHCLQEISQTYTAIPLMIQPMNLTEHFNVYTAQHMILVSVNSIKNNNTKTKTLLKNTRIIL